MSGKSLISMVLFLGMLTCRIDAQIPGEYIATLKDNLTNPFQELERLTALISTYSDDGNTRLNHKYQIGDFYGMAFTTYYPYLLQIVMNDSSVNIVENNTWLNLSSTCISKETALSIASLWGLARISQRKMVNSMYVYEDTAGKDTLVYLVDTGVDLTRDDYQGRIFHGPDVSREDQTFLNDLNGHGVHTTGIVLSNNYGIARKAKAVMVKAWNGTNNQLKNSDVIAALNWITAHHVNSSKELNGSRAKSVINLPVVSKSRSNALSRAIKNIVNHQGLPIVVAAGNSFEDTCSFFPANMTEVITVGAMDSKDRLWKRSNFGNCTDILAPGVKVWSDTIPQGSVGANRNGTSVAAAHVTGVVARYLATQISMPSPAEVKTWLLEESTKDVLEVPQGTPNRLLYMGCNQSLTTLSPIHNMSTAMPVNLTTHHMSNITTMSPETTTNASTNVTNTSTAIPITTTVSTVTTTNASTNVTNTSTAIPITTTVSTAMTTNTSTNVTNTSPMTTTMVHITTSSSGTTSMTNTSNTTASVTTASVTTVTPPKTTVTVPKTTPSASSVLQFSKYLLILPVIILLN